MNAREKIRVAIHIGVQPGESRGVATGGIVQSTQGIVHSLGQLDGPEQYVLVAQTQDEADWIRHYCGPNQQVVVRNGRQPGTLAGQVGSSGRHGSSSRERVKTMLRPSVKTIRRLMSRFTTPFPSVDLSDGYYESLGCDVLHFPTQQFILCALPTVYNPHDLQHLHYPQFFTAWEVAQRETIYRTACQFAQTVVVGSGWIKGDVVRQYRISPDKVQVIPFAPPTAQYPQITMEETEGVCRRLGVPPTYALYPAVTWPHKNHLRLVEALAELRDRCGLEVNLVCTGARDVSLRQVELRIKELNLGSQVKFLGFLSETELRCVYRRAQFLVLPSLFEADSCPIHEAWSEGIPVASSNLTALPDQVGDAGLLFDAKDVSAIAQALEKMATDADLRGELVARGHRRVKDFDWSRTARAYRAVYRRAAGLTLNDEDRWLLEWDWMKEPRKPSPQKEAR
jgi:glycosyltransferase involved in cell wall biosynthesis